ncbi:MAG: 2-dehydropantoate 2-reductase [Candidatus Viridilinea halotolerans]|uniref:2-dehydropantoate 2-reductase n=1 Tax=Candidatus Viridilinea halotolerans TaxID=2491704 RepID=A0A426U2B9_9CHLR|nr:MAG: 2-dehydropantoate 2-reductase [Candidatus Viridilinea halotolerans]
MHITIIGAGALGGLIGFHLAKVTDVTLLDPWAEHVAAINAHGLVCETGGQVAAQPLRAVMAAGHVAPADIALVLVKAHQTPWAATVAAQVLAPHGVAYTLQNGLGNYEQLVATLGAARVGQGVTTLGATLLGAGRVRQAGFGPTTLGSEPDHQRALVVADLLTKSGLVAHVSPDLDGLIWGKLLVNVGINALSAILRVPNGALVTNSAARQLLEAVVHEAAAVAAAKGIALPYADPVAQTLEVARATAQNRSSMLQDILRGSPSEIGAINGAIVRAGAQLGVPTPLNAMLTTLVAAVETLHEA